jgi:hypothetical protein
MFPSAIDVFLVLTLYTYTHEYIWHLAFIVVVQCSEGPPGRAVRSQFHNPRCKHKPKKQPLHQPHNYFSMRPVNLLWKSIQQCQLERSDKNRQKSYLQQQNVPESKVYTRMHEQSQYRILSEKTKTDTIHKQTHPTTLTALNIHQTELLRNLKMSEQSQWLRK